MKSQITWIDCTLWLHRMDTPVKPGDPVNVIAEVQDVEGELHAKCTFEKGADAQGQRLDTGSREFVIA